MQGLQQKPSRLYFGTVFLKLEISSSQVENLFSRSPEVVYLMDQDFVLLGADTY